MLGLTFRLAYAEPDGGIVYFNIVFELCRCCSQEILVDVLWEKTSALCLQDFVAECVDVSDLCL